MGPTFSPRVSHASLALGVPGAPAPAAQPPLSEIFLGIVIKVKKIFKNGGGEKNTFFYFFFPF